MYCVRECYGGFGTLSGLSVSYSVWGLTWEVILEGCVVLGIMGNSAGGRSLPAVRGYGCVFGCF